jgi:predicted RNA-binding Zn-ribbon protein involved in translation (DUF1610 family)
MNTHEKPLRKQDILQDLLSSDQRVAVDVDCGRYLSRYYELVKLYCPACGSDEPRLRSCKHLLEYADCEQCETLYISPRQTPEIFKWFFRASATYAHRNKGIFPVTKDGSLKRIFVTSFDRLLELCEFFGVTTDSLLEFGAGFLEHLVRSGKSSNICVVARKPKAVV